MTCGRRRSLILATGAAAVWLLGTGRALAYIDPGTQTQVVQMLAMVLGTLGVCIGALLWPFKRLLWWTRERYGRRAAWALLGSAAALLVALVVVVALVLFGPEDREGFVVPEIDHTSTDRIILVGMDGLAPAVMRELMDAGELPNFDALRKTGSFASLATTLPPETPVAWSGIGTGCNPGKHGIFDFLHRDPKTYRPILSIYKLNTGNLLDKREKRYLPVRRAPGFWTYATRERKAVTVIRWPAAFPPEPVTGHFLSGLGVPDVRARLGQYTLVTTDAAEAGPSFKGRRCVVAWEGESLTCEVVGPVVAGFTGRKEAKAELVVKRAGEGEVAIWSGSESCTVQVGGWSDYLPVRFKAGLSKTIPAMVRAHLIALEPHLRLYVSTAEVDPMEPYFPFTYPDGYARELAEAIGRYTTLGMPEDVNAMKDGSLSPDAFCAAMDHLFEERRRQFTYELDRFDKGVLAFVFDASDRIQHMFWRTRDPEHPIYDAAFAKQYGHVIPDLYKRMDGVLAEALKRADELDAADKTGKKTAVVVVSDHGFNTFRTSVGLNSWLVDQGYMVLSTADGRNGRELFADVDWSKTRAYSVGFASIYLNLKGREGRGIVRRDDAEALCAELTQKLRALKEPVTGRSVCYDVYRSVEHYRGALAEEAPDLVVGFRAGFRAEDTNVIGGAPAAVFADNRSLWTGDHLMDPHEVPGVFFSNRALRAGVRPRNIDVAPSVLQCLGIRRPETMDGEALFE